MGAAKNEFSSNLNDSVAIDVTIGFLSVIEKEHGKFGRFQSDRKYAQRR
jgi:hypothetical protein